MEYIPETTLFNREFAFTIEAVLKEYLENGSPIEVRWC